jgi:hypothetical protein
LAHELSRLAESFVKFGEKYGIIWLPVGPNVSTQEGKSSDISQNIGIYPINGVTGKMIIKVGPVR